MLLRSSRSSASLRRLAQLHVRSVTSAASSPPAAASGHAVFHRYRALVDDGAITYDAVQVRAVRHLDVLFAQLSRYGGPSDAKRSAARQAAAASPVASSWWQRLTGAGADAQPATQTPASEDATPRGLYIHGGVGCGKVRRRRIQSG